MSVCQEANMSLSQAHILTKVSLIGTITYASDAASWGDQRGGEALARSRHHVTFETFLVVVALLTIATHCPNVFSEVGGAAYRPDAYIEGAKYLLNEVVHVDVHEDGSPICSGLETSRDHRLRRDPISQWFDDHFHSWRPHSIAL